MNGFLKLLSNMSGHAVARSRATVLLPYRSSRWATSGSMRPWDAALSVSKTDATCPFEASSSADDTPLLRCVDHPAAVWPTSPIGVLMYVANNFIDPAPAAR